MLAQLPGRHRRDELLAEAAGVGQLHQLVHRLRHLRHRLPDGCVELWRDERPQAGEGHARPGDEFEGTAGGVRYVKAKSERPKKQKRHF